MDTDRSMQRAIASGESNKQVMELIHNWCRHARVQKAGGTGMIEMETGLPIGHHFMACDHAPAGGFAACDLAQVALDFHDRNCASCAHREAVRLPNLTSLLRQREAYRERLENDSRAREEHATARRTARQQARQSLRVQLDPLSASIVDHLEELDQDTAGDAAARLLGAAQLAPETFTPAVVEHSFGLLEHREAWFHETGLRILDRLQADRARLTRCALLSLAEHDSVAIAATIVEANSGLIDESLVQNALPALIGLANPERTFSLGFDRNLEPGPLVAVYKARSTSTEIGIGKLLDQRDPYLVSAGCRAIQVLAQQDTTIAGRFARSLAAKLAGAKWLIDNRETGFSGDDEVIGRLQDALALALEESPEVTDALLVKFIAGASSESEARIYQVYDNVLSGRRRPSNTQPSPSPAAKVALKRLIEAATTSTNHEVLREVQGALSYVADELTSIIREELTNLLGAAILIDDRVQQFGEEPAAGASFLDRLEHRNHRDMFLSLQSNLIKWAATAASGSKAATEQYIEILARIPEDRDQLRSTLIKSVHMLMGMPEGLNAVLPALYSAMVGTSVRVRAAAARAVGKLDRRAREDVPSLLYEAFTALLSDPYVMVHSAAVEALDRLALSDELDLSAKTALVSWIFTYANSHSNDRFLLICIELYLRRYATDVQKRGNLGMLFVGFLDKVESDALAEKISWFRHSLCATEGFAGVVLRILADPEVSHHRQTDILKALNDLPISAIQANKSQLEALAVAPNADRSLPANLVETLTRAGAWEDAARINEALYARIPDTTEKRIQKLMANLDRIAAKFEEAIAGGKIEALSALALEWRTTEAMIEDDRIACRTP